VNNLTPWWGPQRLDPRGEGFSPATSARGRKEVGPKCRKECSSTPPSAPVCKACQVACKEWNALPTNPAISGSIPWKKRPVAVNFTGDSYDNTGALGATDWRHVRFIEQFSEDRSLGRWLFSSDSCKHCNDAGCLNACPTGAIVRTDLGNVFIRQEVCIGCKYCIPSCPYGVISLSEVTGTVHKCTLCNDRIHNGLGTACAKACPTGSISYGEVAELRSAADKRLAQLKGLATASEHLRVQGGRRPERVLPFPGSPSGVRPTGSGGGPAEAPSCLVGGDDRRRAGPRRRRAGELPERGSMEKDEEVEKLKPRSPCAGLEWYYVAMYFFIGGVSAGAYFIGTLAELFGGERHREISRTGFYIAFR